MEEQTNRSFRLPLVSSAPGKVILFGEHAVVLGKTAIAGSLGLRVYARFDLSDDKEHELVLDLPELKVYKKWKKSELETVYQHPFLQNLNLLEPSSSAVFVESLKNLLSPEQKQTTNAETNGILVFLFLYFVTSAAARKYQTATPPSLKVKVRSYLPIGMGLGSSGSYAVCLTTGLFAAFNIQKSTLMGPKEPLKLQQNIPSSDQKQLINIWAFEAEKIAHGTPSGIDNTVSTYGGTLTLKRIEGSTAVKNLEKTPSLLFLLTNTKVPRNTGQLVAKVREFHQQRPDEANPMLDEIDSISMSCIEEFAKQDVDRVALHKKIGALMARNHELLGRLGVGHPALDKVCETTQRFGFPSKLTGAGGGGCALTLISDGENLTILQLQRSDFLRYICC
eukprot:TRINITY_DN3780_c0_g1_i2.p1 TRINITY_DN3780_c0_g1~~TRINITY_DN3780_c0_g1_i2.p1  ORF type:complete len:393 (-),score=52.13 TRINITY_DN3780_c0_g1_i2:152-1330(-)